MQVTYAIVIVVSIIIFWVLWQKNECKEGMGGYGVTSALHFYNRVAYCDEGNDQGYSGGCMLPHRVII